MWKLIHRFFYWRLRILRFDAMERKYRKAFRITRSLNKDVDKHNKRYKTHLPMYFIKTETRWR